jgi:hypothetical protein
MVYRSKKGTLVGTVFWKSIKLSQGTYSIITLKTAQCTREINHYDNFGPQNT